MMKISPDSTCIHPARAMAPEDFRAQATGIGQTARSSRFSGAMRAQKVVDSMDADDCRDLVPAAEGYPQPSGMGAIMGGVYVGQPAMVQTTQDGELKDMARRLK
jgi:hypothetical protein